MAEANKESRVTLVNDFSKQFLLRDVAVISSSIKRIVRFEEQPRGHFDVEFSMKFDEVTREKIKGLSLWLICALNGFYEVKRGNGQKRSPRRKKAFFVNISIEGFFEVDKTASISKKGLTAEQAYHLASQLHPLLICKVRDQVEAMGYRGLKLPFDLRFEEIAAVTKT